MTSPSLDQGLVHNTVERTRYKSDPVIQASGVTPREYAKEQDQAAGGRSRRIIEFADGRTATASVSLKRLDRQIYAYLRYQCEGKTRTVYVGKVTAATRSAALSRAWGIVQEKGLTHGVGR
jgi:hypothetical protein